MPSLREQDDDDGFASHSQPPASPPSWIKDGGNALIGAIVGGAMARFTGASWFALLCWAIIIFFGVFIILKYTTNPWVRRAPAIVTICSLVGAGLVLAYKWNLQRRPPSKTI